MTDRSNPGLFRYKATASSASAAKSKPGLTNASNVPSSDYDMKSWLKKVESATDSALAGKTSKQQSAGGSVEDEARSLIREWMTSKLLSDEALLSEVNSDSYVHANHSESTRSRSLLEWPHLAGDNDDSEATGATADSELSDAEKIIQRLLNKDYVPAKVLDDEAKVRVDPRIRMELRQQQAREARERRRLAEAEQRERSAEARRLAQEARRLVAEEERAAALRRREEARLVEAEAQRQRRELEERRRQEAALLKEEREQAERERRQTEAAILAERRAAAASDEKRSLRQLRRQALEARVQRRILLNNLALLSRCFANWREILASSRLASGKAAAFRDFRLIRRSFSAWRWHARSQAAEREALAAQNALREAQRRMDWAARRHRQRLLGRAFDAWREAVRLAKLERAAEAEKLELQRRTGKFLERLTAEEKEREQKRKLVEMQQQQQPESQDGALKLDLSGLKVQTNRTTGRTSSANSNRIVQPSVATPVAMVTTATTATSAKTATTNSAAAAAAAAAAATYGGRFEHRFKAQQAILKEQANQLKEQKRLIEELRMEKILVRNQQALTDRPADVQNKPASAAVADCVAPASIIKEPSEGQELTDRTVQPDEYQLANPKQQQQEQQGQQGDSKFLDRMRARAEERARAKADREARRQAAEAERIRLVEAELARAAEAEREAKKRQAVERAQREAARLAANAERRQLELRVVEANRVRLLRHYGLAPWLKLMRQSADNLTAAKLHWQIRLTKRCLLAWHIQVSETGRLNAELADQCYRSALTRRHFCRWTLIRFQSELMETRADQFRQLKLQCRVFYAWHNWTIDCRLEERQHDLLADAHRRLALIRRHFSAWRRLPEARKEENAKRQRLEQLRFKVRDLLPDFDFSLATSSTGSVELGANESTAKD